MRIIDWSSDVCSSDLSNSTFRRANAVCVSALPAALSASPILETPWATMAAPTVARSGAISCACGQSPMTTDRKSVVEGKGGAVRVDVGGGGNIHKKTTHTI